MKRFLFVGMMMVFSFASSAQDGIKHLMQKFAERPDYIVWSVGHDDFLSPQYYLIFENKSDHTLECWIQPTAEDVKRFPGIEGHTVFRIPPQSDSKLMIVEQPLSWEGRCDRINDL